MHEFSSYKFEAKNIPSIYRIVQRACKNIESYWKQNVKKYFNAADRYGGGRYSKPSPNQMENAISVDYAIRHDNIYISVSVKDMFAKDGFNYLNAIQHGVSPGVGAFVPKLGIRIDYGRFEGSTNKKWILWSTAFEKYIDNILMQLQSDIILAIQQYARSHHV